jgi:23S rRNA pseudouridine1911/1915/1917 synthase
MESTSLVFSDKPLFLVVPEDKSGRIDAFLAESYPGTSRTYFQYLIEKNSIQVNNKLIAKPNFKIRPGDTIQITPYKEPARAESYREEAKDLPVQVVYEHEQFLVLNKPAGLVMHQPHKDSTEVTLVDWLQYYYKDISTLSDSGALGDSERPGIVHRLDKDTSGLVLVARTPYAQMHLSELFKERKIKKVYHALVTGKPPKEGKIEYTIERHPLDPLKMIARLTLGKTALTYYKVTEQYSQHALVEFSPVTGRTHQIRVHAAAIEHPLLGDRLYGNASKFIDRHALHAYSLSFEFKGEQYYFKQEPPVDFKQAQQLIAAL